MNYRFSIINKIITAIGARSYLEIGVHYGMTLLQIQPRLNITRIAVDPHFQCLALLKCLTRFYAGRNHYFEMTSDAFFNHPDTPALLEGGLDVAFVDGLHTYQQSLRDCENCLRHLSQNGVIILHDSNPLTRASACSVADWRDEKRQQGFWKPDWAVCWNGTVWKTVLHLRTRSDLTVHTLACAQGVSLVQRIPSTQPLPYTAQDIAEMTYADLEADRSRLLGLITKEDFSHWLKALKPISAPHRPEGGLAGQRRGSFPRNRPRPYQSPAKSPTNR